VLRQDSFQIVVLFNFRAAARYKLTSRSKALPSHSTYRPAPNGLRYTLSTVGRISIRDLALRSEGDYKKDGVA
jgi:hypothetical protein